MQIVGGAVTNNWRRERLIDIILPWALMWFVLSTIGLMASLVSDVLWSDQLLPNLLKPLVFAQGVCHSGLVDAAYSRSDPGPIGCNRKNQTEKST